MTKPASTRRKARKQALDILFEADLRELDPILVLGDRVALDSPSVRPFAAEIVRGVAENYRRIDATIQAAATDWSLWRMPRVDRNLARIAVFELLYSEIAPDVAIAEAVFLGGELSTDNSPAFLNGLLATVAKTRKENQ